MSKNGYYTAFGDFRTVNKVVEHMDPSEDDHDHHDENHDNHHDNHHDTNHDYIKCPKGYVCIPYDEFDQMMRGMDPSNEPPVNEARSLSDRSASIIPIDTPPARSLSDRSASIISMDTPPARSLSDRSASIIPMDTPVLAENMDMPVQAENMDMPRQEE